MNWLGRVKVKHLFTENEDYKSVQTSMSAIADVLDSSSHFLLFNTRGFRSVPRGDDFFKPVDYANKMLSRMYDYADENRIWIE